MISITPQGQVYLCKTPLENDYNNQLTFTNATSQQTYFTSTIFRSDSDYTYIKKDSAIVVNYPVDEIIGCNYLFYKNTGFTNKIYYCFITNMEYVNENATRIYIETDVWQTFMFDVVKKECFVEREHVNDDTFGNNLVDEGLEIGEYMINNANRVTNKLGIGKFVVVVNKFIDGLGSMPSNTNYGSLFSGLVYIYFRNTSDLRTLISAYDGKGMGESILNIFAVPAGMITEPNPFPTYTIPSWGTGDKTIGCYILPSTDSAYEIETELNITRQNTLDDYTPKNNKLLQYPYNYLYINNNCGDEMIYKWEEFFGTPTFNIDGALCPGCAIKMYPLNYKGYTDIPSPSRPHLNPKEYCFGISGGKYPNCSWTSDAYTNWLTQNAVNLEGREIIGGARIIGSALPLVGGNIDSASESFIEGMTDVFSVIKEKNEKEKFLPNNTKGNVNGGDLAYSTNSINFMYYKMSIKRDAAKRIDDFFSMYGYKVNSLKIPNITGRTNWNYVKTVGCTFEGDIPQTYLNKIKQIFNRGITFWHNPSTFLDYSQSNTIVS